MNLSNEYDLPIRDAIRSHDLVIVEQNTQHVIHAGIMRLLRSLYPSSIIRCEFMHPKRGLEVLGEVSFLEIEYQRYLAIIYCHTEVVSESYNFSVDAFKTALETCAEFSKKKNLKSAFINRISGKNHGLVKWEELIKVIDEK